MVHRTPTYLECSFLIPTRRDAVLSDGGIHPISHWDWLEGELWDHFHAATQAPGLYYGFYSDPDTGARVADRSRRYYEALPENRIDELRDFLREVCVMFHQKSVYLSVAGKVEFIEHPNP